MGILDREPDDPTVIVAWQFIESYNDQLRAIIKRACRNRRDVEDEMYSDVVPTAVVAAMSTYDSKKGNLKAHVMRTVRLRSLKWWWRWRKWYSYHSSIEQDVLVENDHGVSIEVYDLLDKLCPYDRGVIVMYHLMEMTFEEVALVLSVSKGTARNHYKIAIKRLYAMSSL